MTNTTDSYVLCIKNRGYAASLQTRMVYRTVSDPEASSHGMLRIVDETGEDYLFPASFFVRIDLPEVATRVFAGAA